MRRLRRSRRGLCAGILCGLAWIGFVCGPARGAVWQVQQITNNTTDDGPPQVYGSTVAWSRWFHDPVGTSQWELLSYDGVSTTQLTSNYTHDVEGAPGEAGIFYLGWDGHDVEVFFHDGATTTQLTNTDYYEGPPTSPPKAIRTSGVNAAWGAPIGTDWQVVLYEGGTGAITQLSSATFGDWNNYSEARIDGTRVVWSDWDGDTVNYDDEIFYYDGTTVTQLTNNAVSDLSPRISGTNVVWQGGAGDTEIFLYDGTTITQLTDNALGDVLPEVAGDRVAWVGWDGSDWEVFLYDGATTTQLTDNSLPDQEVRISESAVAWLTWDGNDYEVFLYDGATVTQLTDDAVSHWYLEISGSTLAWNGFDGFDTEIFVATPIPEPGSLALLGGFAAALRRRRRRAESPRR